MTRFIILVLLLTGRLVRGVTENIVTSAAGSTVTLEVESVGEALKCVLETNRGEKLEFTPGFHRIRTDIECIDKRTCTFRINEANDTHAGVWKVMVYTAKKESEENADLHDDITPEVFLFGLYIRQEKAAISSQYIDVYDGHYINMKYEYYKNLTACNLTGPKMESINLLMEKRNNFQLFGQCGVRMKVNATYEGSWKLDAVVNNYMLYYTSFNIYVHQLKQKDPNDMLVLQWTRGSPGIISLSGLPKICQIVDPNGVTVATSLEKCYHQVKVATVQHEGIWLARYNMYGMLEPIEQKFKIETFDQVIFNANITRIEDGSIRLFCQLEIKDIRPESCSFIRPDGRILYMTPVIGTER